MKYISLPEEKLRRLSFYLSMEEYIARFLDEEESFFMWQVNPTVIFGRNQLMENEVNLDYVRQNGIETYRRKSGGGCVYADFSNIMFSYITKDYNVSLTFTKYLQRVSDVLQQLGLDAKPSGRNDIIIGDKKVSGNAFYHAAGKSIVHGTMLFNTDVEVMVKSITPNNDKLITKGVESVRKRVTNLSEHLDIDIESFKEFVRSNLCEEELILTDEDISRIKIIEEDYLSDEFIFGNNPRYTLIKKGYNEAGEVEIRLEIKNGIIKSINLMGDYFLVGDLDNGLLKKIIYLPYKKEYLTALLDKNRIENYILNLTTEQFLNILFSKNTDE